MEFYFIVAFIFLLCILFFGSFLFWYFYHFCCQRKHRVFAWEVPYSEDVEIAASPENSFSGGVVSASLGCLSHYDDLAVVDVKVITTSLQPSGWRWPKGEASAWWSVGNVLSILAKDRLNLTQKLLSLFTILLCNYWIIIVDMFMNYIEPFSMNYKTNYSGVKKDWLLYHKYLHKAASKNHYKLIKM